MQEESVLSVETSSPRLLISVRNLEEARIARVAGVDLIDLKEPYRGSLGMVEMTIAEQIATEMPDAQLSLALGELTDWNELRDIPRIPLSFRYLKLGLAQQSENPRWRQDWRELRQSVNECSGKSFGWIAVVYADADAARSPAPAEIIEAARETQCAGVLFDTWTKTSGSLADHLPIDSLESYIKAIQSAGMLAALAGSVREAHLPLLLPLGADLIAVRGAVCSANDRTAGVEAEAMVRFKRLLNSPVESPLQ